MFNVAMTPNLLGIKISGSYDDLDKLYDAVWSLCLAEDDLGSPTKKATLDEVLMCNRLLALCYDLRHAYMGTRNVDLEPSDVDQGVGEWLGIELPDKKVVLSVEVLYPEAIYEALVLDYLIKRRQRVERIDTMLDENASMVRLYLAKLLKAIETGTTKGRYAKICEFLHEGSPMVPSMYTQWVDVLDCDYGSMSKKQRTESMATTVRDLSYFWRHNDYHDMKKEIDDAVNRQERQYPGLRNELRFNLEWPGEDRPW